jgi:probable HAF family extracellular repeat protein
MKPASPYFEVSFWVVSVERSTCCQPRKEKDMNRALNLFLSVLAVLILSATAGGQTPPAALTYQTIDMPGANRTRPFGINAQGDVVGIYFDDTGRHSFVLSRGVYREFVLPGNISPRLLGINASGALVGEFPDSNGDSHGFMFFNGRLTVIDVNGPNSTSVGSVNDAGEVFGYYNDGSGVLHAFKYSDGAISFFATPGTLTESFVPAGTDNGALVCTFDNLYEGDTHGLLLTKKKQTVITYLDAPFTRAAAVSPSGVVVGGFAYQSNSAHGFLWSDGEFALVDYPDAVSTNPRGINSAGVVVGFYKDSSLGEHGFVAKPSR